MPIQFTINRRLRGGSVYTGTSPNVADFTDRAVATDPFVGRPVRVFSVYEDRIPWGALMWPAQSDRGAGFRIQVDVTVPSQFTGYGVQRVTGLRVRLSNGVFLRASDFIRLSSNQWVSKSTINTSVITGAENRYHGTSEIGFHFGPGHLSATAIPNRTADTSGPAQTLDVASYIQRTGGFRLPTSWNYFANTSNNNVVTVSLSGTQLTMTPGATAGTATIRVAGTQPSNSPSARTDFTFTVAGAASNPAPTTVGTISDRTAQTSGSAQTLNVASFFTDTDALTYAARSSNTSVVAVSVSGSTLTMTPGATAGTSTITVTATDTAAQNVSQTFSFTTSAPNPAPTAVGTIPNRNVNVSSAAFTENLASYFSDTDTLTYSAASSSTGIAAVSVSGSTLTVTPGNVAGTATITATATDTANQSINQTFTVTTAQVQQNPAPVRVGTMGNITAQVSTGAQQRDVAPFFTDTDALTYAAISSNTGVVAVSVSGSTLTMTPGATAGTATVSVTATDTASQSVVQTFTFTTTAAPPVNAPPTRVGTINSRTAQTGSGAQVLDVSAFFRDTDALTYAATSSSTGAVAVSVRGSTLTMTPGTTPGVSTITVTATDTASQSINQTFTFTLSTAPPINPPPVRVGTPPARVWQIGVGNQTVDMSVYFSDANDTLTYAATSSAIRRVSGEIHSQTGMLTLELLAVGRATITVTATDTAGQDVAQAFLVTVTSDAPVGPAAPDRILIANAIPTQTLQQDESRDIALRDFVSYTGDENVWAWATSTDETIVSGRLVDPGDAFNFFTTDLETAVLRLNAPLRYRWQGEDAFVRQLETMTVTFATQMTLPVTLSFNVIVEARENHIVRIIPDRAQRMSDGVHRYHAGPFFSAEPAPPPEPAAIMGGAAVARRTMPASTHTLAWDSDNSRITLLSGTWPNNTAAAITLRGYDPQTNDFVEFQPGVATRTFNFRATDTRATGMAYLDGTLYAIGFDWTVYRFNAARTAFTRLPALTGTVGNPEALTGLDGMLYAIANNILYRFDPNVRSVSRVGNVTMPAHFLSLANHEGMLYTIRWSPAANADLYTISTDDGSITRVGTQTYALGETNTRGPTSLVGVPSTDPAINGLYAQFAHPTQSFYRIP